MNVGRAIVIASLILAVAIVVAVVITQVHCQPASDGTYCRFG